MKPVAPFHYPQHLPPRGFAAAYKRAAAELATGPVLRDLLALIGYSASLRTIARWPVAKRVEAEVYAVRVHLRASDNPVRVPPRPAWMPDPWKGRKQGRGIWTQPKGTVLP